MVLRRALHALAITVLLLGASAAPVLADGANGDCGAYCPTPDDGHQGNGNAPTDGSVGNADDKNPPGQGPDGSDGNSGYECDEQTGVGDGNPAHTGCSPSPTPSPTPTPNPTITPTPIVTPTVTPTETPTPMPTVTPTPTTTTPTPTAPSTPPVPVSPPAGPGSGLPVTGAWTEELGLLGLALLSTGGGLVVLGRRRLLAD